MDWIAMDNSHRMCGRAVSAARCSPIRVLRIARLAAKRTSSPPSGDGRHVHRRGFHRVVVRLAWSPWVYAQAMTTVDTTGLTLALDAVQLVELTLAVMWIFALLGATVGATLGAGVFGRIHRENIATWRWRISLPVVLLIVTSTWTTTNDLRWPLAIASALLLEMPLLPWRNTAPRSLPTVLDAEGGRRRLLVVDCACEGAFGLPPYPPKESTGHHIAQGLCARMNERTSLMERIQDGRATDVVVVGCSTAPLPQAFKEAVASAGAQLRGLNLREIEHRRPSIQPRSMACQRDLLLSAFVDPWSKMRQPNAPSNTWQRRKGTLCSAPFPARCPHRNFGCSMTRGEGALKPHARDLTSCNVS